MDTKQISYYWNKGRSFLQTLFKNKWERQAFLLKRESPDNFEMDNSGLFMKELNLHLAPGTFLFVLESYNILREFSSELRIRARIGDQKIYLSFSGLNFEVTTAEEIYILGEIYLHGTYQFSSCKSLVFLDVGMNVGFASLFFANRPSVKAVYSFEPFEPTYLQAVKNLGLNSNIAGKITPFNFGLDGKEHKLKVDFNYENKGQVGVLGTSLIRSEITSSEKLSIFLKMASSEVKNIISRHGEMSYGLKLDCEGAEYAILLNLDDENLLHHFDLIFIEWHEKGPHELVEILKRNHFTSFYQQSIGRKVGMIYASK